jgi:hypothetical protein
MSDTNQQRHEITEEESLPFLNWHTVSGIILLVIFAVFVGYDIIVQSPKAKLGQSELEIEFESIAPLPNASVVDYDSSHKTSQALVNATYLTSVKPADIFNHYDEQLRKHGWQSYGASGMTDWGRDLGGKSAYYCKDDYYAQLQYAGEQAHYGWTYAFSVSWGLSNCETKPKGGWVKQTVPVSLLFMAFGAFFVINAVDIAKNAWAKNSVEYAKWIRRRNRIKSESSFFSFVPKSYSLWNSRIFSIVGIIMGLFVTWVGAYSLWRNIFGG